MPKERVEDEFVCRSPRRKSQRRGAKKKKVRSPIASTSSDEGDFHHEEDLINSLNPLDIVKKSTRSFSVELPPGGIDNIKQKKKSWSAQNKKEETDVQQIVTRHRRSKSIEERKSGSNDAVVIPTLTEEELPSGSVVWKRNPEADAIRIMLLKQMEMEQEEEKRRKTIQVEQKEKELQEQEKKLLGSNLKDESTKASISKRIRSPTVASTILRFPGSRKDKRVSAEFTISKSDDAPLESLEKLESEFNSFSGAGQGDENENDEPVEKIDKRTKVVLEIRSAEKNFIGKLKTLVTKYYFPFLNKKKRTTDYNFLEVEHIFSNITDVLRVHQPFLQNLEKRVDNWQSDSTIGDLFVSLAQNIIKFYNVFGENYENSLTTIEEYSKNPLFEELLTGCYEASQTKLKLESLLISPIQHIPRYILLLNDLLKSTPDTHPDHALIKNGIIGMQEVADSLNRNVSQGRFKAYFREIIKQADGLKQSGRVLLHQEIIVRCEASKKNIILLLFNDLLVHLPETKLKNKAIYGDERYQWPMNLIWIKENREFTKIIGPSGKYKIRTTDIQAWKPQLETAIKEYLSKQDYSDKDEEVSLYSAYRYGSYEFEPTVGNFSGRWNYGKMELGKYSYSGNIYDGHFIDGLKDGYGTLITRFGNTYTGYFAKGRPHGEGTQVDKQGNKYTGYFVHGLKQGHGIMKFSSGDIYEGEWVNDTPQGQGTMIYSSGNIYKGNWDGGFYHNFGTLTVGDTTYEGMFNYGLKEGKGIMTGPKGIYDGDWKANLKEGFGEYTTERGVYSGEWVADLQEGKGTVTFSDSYFGTSYTGQFKRGQFHGQGKIVYATSNVQSYEGEWIFGRKNGKGLLVFCNTDTFDGFFKDGQFNGTGIYTFSNGMAVDGKWNRGQLEGKIALVLVVDKTKRVFNGTCKDNLLTLENMILPLEIEPVPIFQADIHF